MIQSLVVFVGTNFLIVAINLYGLVLIMFVSETQLEVVQFYYLERGEQIDGLTIDLVSKVDWILADLYCTDGATRLHMYTLHKAPDYIVRKIQLRKHCGDNEYVPK